MTTYEDLNSISEYWIFTTMLIEDAWKGMGTGFLVAQYTQDQLRTSGSLLVHSEEADLTSRKPRRFLITNKHVLAIQNYEDEDNSIMLTANTRAHDHAPIQRRSFPFKLQDVDGTALYRMHPDENVDVAALDLGNFLDQYPDILVKSIPHWLLASSYDYFLSDGQLIARAVDDVTIGDDVIIVGYPSGIFHAHSNFPLVRHGIIASRIGERIVTGKDQRGTRGFLIDGGITPGASGSVVIHSPDKERISHASVTPKVIGIVAATEYAEVKVDRFAGLGFANLGVAFDAETIEETIGLFSR